MMRLAIYRAGVPDRYADIPQTIARIGRASENDVVLEDPTKGVSRIHAELRREQGRWVIVDLNSQNGVHVGGRRVTREVVDPGTPITVGPYEIVLEEVHGAAAEEVSPGDVTQYVQEAPVSTVDARPAPAPRPAPPGPGSGPVPGPSRGRPGASHVVPIAAAVLLLLLAGGAFAWLKMGRKAPPPPVIPVQEAEKPKEPEKPPVTEETPLQQNLRVATERLDAKDRDGAAAAIEEALRLSPDSAEVIALKARLDTELPLPPPPPTDLAPPPIPDWPASLPKPRKGEREAPAAYVKRALQLLRHYQVGSGALERGEPSQAITEFEAALGFEPGFHDTPGKLLRAREMQRAAQAREEATRAFEAGRAHEGRQEVGAAVTQYQRVLELDPARKEAADSIERLRRYINEQVPGLLRDVKNARAFDTPKKAEPILEQLLRILPESDPRRRDIEQQLKDVRALK